MPQSGAQKDIPEPDPVRLAVSLRIKAARHLAGGPRETKAGYEAGALTVDELAKRPLLVENGITKNRLDSYEQMKVTPRPMDLEKIADALGVERSFLLAPLGKTHGRSVEDHLAALEETLADIKDQLPRLGRDIGRRDLRWRAERGRRPAAAPVAASGTL